MVSRTSPGRAAFNLFNYTFLATVAFAALYPFLYVISISLSPPAEAYRAGLHLFPRELTLDAYRALFNTPEILVGYINTILRTVVGTLATLLFTCLCAYPLSCKHLPGRKWFIFAVVFTMLFSGGIVPLYLTIRELHLLNNRLVYVLPLLITGFNVIVVKSFFEQIPESYAEAARIDGANEFQLLFQFFVPLSQPVLATVALWTAVMHWNMWFDAMLYISDDGKQVLQTFLQRIVVENSVELAEKGLPTTNPPALTSETLKAATVVITILPMLVLYPFLQRYFVKGIQLGGVKQ